MAIGNPFGLGETVTSGIVSARWAVAASTWKTTKTLSGTDAAINRGNSGGALAGTSTAS
ncbi:hypothetical protein MJ588_05595 [Klebsiella pneumoniae]|nr:hypothetical protein MJ588_05595 [Klebsiella pneumoniae]